MNRNEELQVHALVRTATWDYKKESPYDGPGVRFIELCDLLGCPWQLPYEFKWDRWKHLSRHQLYLDWENLGELRYCALTWLETMDRLVLQLNPDQYNLFCNLLYLREYHDDLAVRFGRKGKTGLAT